MKEFQLLLCTKGVLYNKIHTSYGTFLCPFYVKSHKGLPFGQEITVFT